MRNRGLAWIASTNAMILLVAPSLCRHSINFACGIHYRSTSMSLGLACTDGFLVSLLSLVTCILLAMNTGSAVLRPL